MNSIIVGIVASLGLDMPWLLGILTGLMMNAVSPTVVVILMLQMIMKGQGLERGIP